MTVVLYADLDEFKARLNITSSTSDADLSDALEAASRGVEKDTGRRFWLDTTATARIFNPNGRTSCDPGGERLVVDDMGAAPTLVEIGYGATFAPVTTGYELAPDNAIVRDRPITCLVMTYGTWGYGVSRVRVTAQWGWPVIPPEIKQATLIRAQRLWRRKDTPDGMASFADAGVLRLSRTDPDYQAAIANFQVPGFG